MPLQETAGLPIGTRTSDQILTWCCRVFCCHFVRAARALCGRQSFCPLYSSETQPYPLRVCSCASRPSYMQTSRQLWITMLVEKEKSHCDEYQIRSYYISSSHTRLIRC